MCYLRIARRKKLEKLGKNSVGKTLTLPQIKRK